MHTTRLHFVACAVIAAASAIAQKAQAPVPAFKLDIVITDTNVWRTHPPGASFHANVHVVGDPSLVSTVTCRWVDEHRQPLGEAIPMSEKPKVVQSPSTAPGFYGLVFTSTDPRVAFPPQPAGFPSAVQGFAVLPPPPSGTPVIEPTSPFGMVQANIEDPYLWSGSGPRVLGIHLKTKSWSQSARSWASSIRERPSGGHTEMPLINNAPWDSVDTQPIERAQLDLIGTRFATLLQAEPRVEYWQAGREENGGGEPYEKSHYFSNLLAKMTRLRAEADAINPDVKFAYSTRGNNMVEFEQLFASKAFADCYDGLAHDVYQWPDFPTPERWLPGHISDIRTRMIKAGRARHFFWFGECGLPVRGTNDPNAFFGYPSRQSRVPGASLDYAATYLVKFHALAIADGINRIYWYNYKNRGNDIDYAEHHFGLRSYSGSDDPGRPLPAYVAYVTMLAHLKGCSFVELRHPTPNVFVFEFAVDGTAQRRILAWVEPAQSVTLALTSLRHGLLAAGVQSASDIYGRPVAAISGEQITLDGRPLFLRY